MLLMPTDFSLQMTEMVINIMSVNFHIQELFHIKCQQPSRSIQRSSSSQRKDTLDIIEPCCSLNRISPPVRMVKMVELGNDRPANETPVLYLILKR